MQKGLMLPTVLTILNILLTGVLFCTKLSCVHVDISVTGRSVKQMGLYGYE